MGDPAGIGPEIVVRALASAALRRIAHLAVAGDPDVLERAARRVRSRLAFRVLSPGDANLAAAFRGTKAGIPLIASTQDGWAAIRPGSPTPASGRMAAKAIEAAARAALDGLADGI